VIICGASFAGLTVARQMAGSGAKVLLLDRYEIGERQTSACGIPTEWLHAMGLGNSERQEFPELVVHTPKHSARYDLPFHFSTFDYRTLCNDLDETNDAEFETAKVEGRTGETVHTDRGDVTAPLIVDALGWRRILASDGGYQPPDAPLSRGLEVHPDGVSDDLEVWLDRRYVPAGYGWSFPAAGEQRIGVGSFDPKFHVRETTELLADDLERDKVRYQGNWIPHKIRDGVENGIFFCGDSAGHCLPLTAEGIRTAFYFGLALGNELRAVYEGEKPREQALKDYQRFTKRHFWKFNWMLRTQKLVPKLPPLPQRLFVRFVGLGPVTRWSFKHYLRIAPPEYAVEHLRPPARREAPAAAEQTPAAA
jgi:flavin-dependent dehydrogenase